MMLGCMPPSSHGRLHSGGAAPSGSALHADDQERLEYLHRRILEAQPLGAGKAEEHAAERLALIIGRLADRGDDWAKRVRRHLAPHAFIEAQ